jgi:hypothetical protein
MTQDELDRQAEERGKRTVESAERARQADQPVLQLADQLVAEMQALRRENHWATKVRRAFREGHA